MPAKIEKLSRRIVESPIFELLVVFLIVASIVLLTDEIVLPQDHPHQFYLYQVQNWITGFFIVELSIRYLASRRRQRFLKDYWIDILAILPFFRVFRFARFLRLLRLLRMVRLATLLTSNSRLFQFLLRRRAAEYILGGLVVGFCLISGVLSYSHFEQSNQGMAGLSESVWRVSLMLIAGELPSEPTTWGGRLVILFVAIAGLGIVAFMIGTISALMIEKLREGALLSRMELEELDDHLLICGWNSGVETVLQELQRHPQFAQREIVVIAEREDLNLHELPNPRKIRLLREDFTRVEVLQKANAMTASVAIIVSDVGHNRTRQDADARTVLAALTIEKLNPNVYTCAELSNAMNEPHLRMGQVDEVIVTQDLAGRLLAQAALNSAHVRVFQELLRFGSGARMAAHPVPKDMIGRPFTSILTEYRCSTGSLPIAICDASDEVDINPESRLLREGDQLLCIDNPPSR